MRILITGGAGFIGSNLAHLAVTDPAVNDLRILDDLSTGDAANLKGLDVPLLEGSILDDSALDRVMPGVDTVIHLAALPSVPRSVADPVASHDANATGTLSVLQAARRHGVGHVVLASSSSVYGANPTLPKHEDCWTRPLSPYAASKLAAESYALAFQNTYGISTLAFRFFNVYGPRQRHDHAYAAVVPKFVHAALTGQPVIIHGDGRQSRDFTYVETVCRILLTAARQRTGRSGPVNLAFGTRTELLTVLTTLEEIVGRPIAREHTPTRAGDVRHSQADSTVVRELFPDVNATDLATGIQSTVEWFQRNVVDRAPAGATR